MEEALMQSRREEDRVGHTLGATSTSFGKWRQELAGPWCNYRKCERGIREGKQRMAGGWIPSPGRLGTLKCLLLLLLL